MTVYSRLLVAICIFIALPASAQTWTSASEAEIRARLQQLEVEMQSLRGVGGFSNTSGVASTDTLGRLDSIEAELQRLTGLTEQLQFQQQQIISNQSRKIDDLEFRLSEIERLSGITSSSSSSDFSGGGVSIPESTNTGTAVAVPGDYSATSGAAAPAGALPSDYSQSGLTQTAEKPVESDIYQSSQDQNVFSDQTIGQSGTQNDTYQTNGGFQTLDVYGAGTVIYTESGQTLGTPEGTLGTIPNSANGTVTQAQDGSYSGIYQSNDSSVASLGNLGGGTAGNPQQTYDAAIEKLRVGDFSNAQTGFQQFLNSYPQHELAGNAQYWLGETYYVRASYDEAAQSFLNGFQQYPNSRKAPDSLLKLGMTLERMGQTSEACLTFTELQNRYPNASASVLRRAGTEAARAGCS